MKKKILVVAILMAIFMNVQVNATVGQVYKDEEECRRVQSRFTTISTSQGSAEYVTCYRVGCDMNNSQPEYIKTSLGTESAYRCQNGNFNPYVAVTSDGCKSFTGKCTVSRASCSIVRKIDCNRTSSGGVYNSPTTTTTVTTTNSTTTTRRTTTKSIAPTTKTTAKKVTTTKKQSGSTATSTSSSTTTTTETTTTEYIPSNNNNIKKILIGGTKLNYNNEKSDYTIQANAKDVNVDVSVELEDEKSTYTVEGNTNMIPNEEGNIVITVSAEDGTKRYVNIKVIRYNLPESGCNLSNIYIEGYDLNFSKNTYEYTLKIPNNINTLDISAIAVDEEGSYIEINGNENLKNKSKIEISVTGSDESNCLYKINIKKTSNLWKIILAIVLIVAIVVVVVYLVLKKMRKSKGRYQYE